MCVYAHFWSDIEKNRCAALTAERLEKLVTILNLDDANKTTMYDLNLAAQQRISVATDLTEYIMERDYVITALRTTCDLDD